MTMRMNHQNTNITKLCVLMSANEGCEYGDVDPPADIAQHLTRGGFPNIQVETVFLTCTDFPTQLIGLAKRFENKEIDCFINLCDGAWDEPSPGISVVDLLENKLNLPFTGADLTFYEPSRLQMKKAAISCGVLVPAWRFIHSNEDILSFIREFQDYTTATDNTTDTYTTDNTTNTATDSSSTAPLNFPLIVKHFSSYASVGLTKDSKVWNVHDLKTQCERMLDTYGGCLVEEFIQGREFTVLAAHVPSSNNPDDLDIVAFEPVECAFGQDEDFKHFNLKWVDYDNIFWKGIKDVDLCNRLKQQAKNVFRALGGRGYGRIDVRSDPTGQHLYFLEINPNCGIFYPEGAYGSADFILDRLDTNNAHAQFILDQVEVARRLWMHKYRMKHNSYETRYNARTQSWGMFALRDLKAGDVIVNHEETAFHLVSKQHVLNTWKNSPKQSMSTINNTNSNNNNNDPEDVNIRNWQNFASYCWPVSDDLFVMWNPDPDDWKPINHSCDPNAWNEFGNGLNVVARRTIKQGEEICMDYATFVGYFPEMQSFECQCKSRNCRGLITGLDVVHKPELMARYRNHMSSYVAMKAKEFHGNGIMFGEHAFDMDEEKKSDIHHVKDNAPVPLF